MGYDDWGRLLNDNCGSVWAQTFSYDQYDNLTKSGSITWNPGYSSTTNRYTLAGTSYDSNGNLTNDTLNTYAFNEFSKLKSVGATTCGSNGKCIVYDAFGRIVETSSGSTWKERWYTQLGETANMSGSTINFAYWPSPGGGTTVISGNASGCNYMHKDWLGSARIVSSCNNHTVGTDQAFAPYGEVYDQLGSTNATYQMFTGDTQNFDSGVLYDTPNRELNQSQGRWLSPDPAGAGWNLYAYGTNPNSGVDPSGLFMINPGMFLGYAAFSNTMASMDAFGLGFDNWINSTFFSTVPGNSPPPPPTLSNVSTALDPGRLAIAQGFDSFVIPPVGSPDALATLGPSDAQLIPMVFDALSSLMQDISQSVCGDTTGACFALIPLAGTGVSAAEDAGPVLTSLETALVPMTDAAEMYGSTTTLAGYQIAGTSGMVGNTYMMNVWGLYATENAQGLGNLTSAIVSQAEGLGASQISITGNAVVNAQLSNAGIAARYGWTYQQINSTTFSLTMQIP